MNERSGLARSQRPSSGSPLHSWCSRARGGLVESFSQDMDGPSPMGLFCKSYLYPHDTLTSTKNTKGREGTDRLH